MTAEPAMSRRERTRSATLDEIKSTARELMHEQGSTDVRFTDIARAMGLSAPALYRYFDDRDELISALISDGFDSLGAAVAAASAPIDDADILGRWVAAAGAYRDWARDEPQRFALVLGMPVPGYSEPTEGMTTEAASRAMSQLSALFVAAAERGELRPPLIREASPELAVCQELKHEGQAELLPPESFQALLQTWAMLHGLVSLEVNGNLDWLTPQARDELFLSQVRLAALTAGLADPAA
ncbi:TetR/AcrR family transcriptional regulator [Pengzhenrongella sicca]|uniref:TetR/AcrR family transcriptional regulator n=1 Tax=Pengzhenrongella sicca TaxID=2819238 RepID=A0A8A4ZDZ7_9MICO|nr:TetR/AcrR family transcriptional regulator [Pengzhenrongella sicca]QTE29249.1 TetR/AcrR family transcriptional regulator [Pengzhenrongella sicca]